MEEAGRRDEESPNPEEGPAAADRPPQPGHQGLAGDGEAGAGDRHHGVEDEPDGRIGLRAPGQFVLQLGGEGSLLAWTWAARARLVVVEGVPEQMFDLVTFVLRQIEDPVTYILAVLGQKGWNTS